VILAIDQGTTGTTCLVLDGGLRVLGRGYARVPQHFPRPGWVEQEPGDLLASVEAAAGASLRDAGVSARELDAVGIANQRETTVVWDRATGEPLHRAIVWQDRRTAERCRELPAGLLRERTGLVPDPYFSATKLEWILRELGPEARRPGLAFGTVDTWLVWKLTRGGRFVTDASNASRTLLYDVRRLAWDDELLALFGVAAELLPEVVASSGEIGEAELAGAAIPIRGLAGDQQAALVGQACVEPGQGKATYGTGGFLLVNAGADATPPAPGLLLTLQAQLAGHAPGYALEGSILSVGAAIDWLAGGLGLLESAAEADALARSVADNAGVHFVPALSGLGAPHWRPEARGLVSGLTPGANRAHVARAALEAVAFQTRDVLDLLPVRATALRVDGGVTASGFAMQFLADVAGIPVHVAAEREATAIGAAALAALGSGTLDSPAALRELWRASVVYEPTRSADEAAALHAGWAVALERALMRRP
jgi:glycerol kinase